MGQNGGQQATVTIFGLREVDDRTQAVDPSNVSGNISVLLDVQYNDETVTNIDLTLGEEVISCRGASSDAASPVGLADSGGSVEVECFFDTDQVAGACEGMQLEPRFANGEHELGAQITTADGSVRQALASQMITLKNSNYVVIDHNPGSVSRVVQGVTYYGGPTTEDNVNTFDVCPVAFDGTVVGAIGLRGQTGTQDGNSLTFSAHRRSWLYGEFWGARRTDDEAPFTFTAHSDWNGRNGLPADFDIDDGIEDINPAREGSGGHWIIQDGVISDPDGVDISSKFVPGDAENNLTKIGPIYFDFNAPRVTDASQVTIEGKAIEEVYYSGMRGTTDGRSQRIWISNVSEQGSGGQYGSTSQVVAVGDCSISANADTGERGAGTAFQALVEDANAIGDLPEDDPYGDELSDDGGVQCYTAELQSITDPIGNSRALNNVRIRSANNFGVDKTPPEIDNLVPDEELVLMEGAVLTFEVDDPELETGENGSGIDADSTHAYWGPSASFSQRYFYSAQDDAPPGVVSDVVDGVVTISTDTGDEEADKERRYVVVARVHDNAVPPHRTSAVFTYTRDSKGPGVSLSKSQSDIGSIGTATVTVGVGGTISDKNVIKTAELSIRNISAAGATCSDAANEMSQGQTGRVVRNRRDLENDTNEIVFDESFTIRRPTGEGAGPETYCFWLASADVAVEANGRGTGNRGNYELGSFTVGWPSTPVTPPGPTFEFSVDELGVGEGQTIQTQAGDPAFHADDVTYMVSLENGSDLTFPLEVTITSQSGSVTTFPTTLTFAAADDEFQVAVGVGHDRDVTTEAFAVTHTANGVEDGDLTVMAEDDDVSLSLTESSITEGADAMRLYVVGTLTTARDADLNVPITIDPVTGVTTTGAPVGGVAVALDFVAGEMVDSLHLELAVNDNAVIQSGLSILIRQSTSTGEAPFVVPATMTVVDDDPNVTLTVTPASLNEGDDATTLTISAESTVAMPGPFDVEVTIPVGAGYTANGVDSTGSDQTVTLTIDAGETASNSKTVSIDPLEDTDSNNITFEITAPGTQIGDAGKTYSVKGATVTIVDNDS